MSPTPQRSHLSLGTRREKDSFAQVDLSWSTRMKALTWHGKSDVRCEAVPDPKIQDGRDAIIKVTACAICGSDLHLFDGIMPTMERGDVLGHETMGEVVEVGKDNKKLKVGDRVVVPLPSHAANASFARMASIRVASAPTPTPRKPRRCGAIRPPACSATRTCLAASQAARPNI
jgi:threonine dehydrogenase-like Zn-dependent dehydrogenase